MNFLVKSVEIVEISLGKLNNGRYGDLIWMFVFGN